MISSLAGCLFASGRGLEERWTGRRGEAASHRVKKKGEFFITRFSSLNTLIAILLYKSPDPDFMQQATQEEEGREQLGKSAQGESLNQEHQVSRIVIL